MMKYSIIIPVYNEELVVRTTCKRLKAVMEQTDGPYELLFVNDGSRDATMEILKELAMRDETVKYLDFSRNFGHQIAITAGMDHALGEAIVIIDADLQDPPELILEMIQKWKEGYEVVYAKRTKRKGETFFKKQTAHLFYRLLQASTEIDIPLDTGDFRLIDRKVCDELVNMKERSRFVRGMVSWVGFKQTAIEYERDERFAGETKYPLKKMLRFSIDGITSFSYKPLKIASLLGFLLSFSSAIWMLVVLYLKLFTDSTITGWSSLLMTMLFFHGVVLMMLGVSGEYIGRIYDEAKNRPIYILQSSHGVQRKMKKPQLEKVARYVPY